MSSRTSPADGCTLIYECDDCGFSEPDGLDFEHDFKNDRDICPMCVRERIEKHLAQSRERNVVKDATEGSKSWLYDLI